jgi:glycosyltransferase involved in cell wall biosynthesis
VADFDVLDQNKQRRPVQDLHQSLEVLLKELSPQCVHANSLSMARLLGGIAESCPVPCLGHLRDMIRISRASVAHLNALGRLLAVSSAVKQWYVVQGVDAHKIQVLYNGVDLQRFAPRPSTGYLLRELKLPDSAFLLGAIGQIGMRKGLDVLLEAAVPIVQRFGNAHLVVVGQRYSRKEEAIQFEQGLLRAAPQHPLRAHVHFLGVRDNVDQLLHEMDILVHAARQEPLGRVLLEAAAAGRPIVATRVGGTCEIFPPETGTALLVPAGDADALTFAIQQLIAAPSKREFLGKSARERAVQMFSAKKAALGLAGQYRRVLAQSA